MPNVFDDLDPTQPLKVALGHNLNNGSMTSQPVALTLNQTLISQWAPSIAYEETVLFAWKPGEIDVRLQAGE